MQTTGRWVNKTLMDECTLLCKNALMHASVCRLTLPPPKCAAVAKCKRARAYGCGFVSGDSLFWNEGSGASLFLTGPRSLV